ncbi:3-oxoacyl-ACP synthase III family protein [Mucilaginibacter jinjuensis]|uniref:Ketoacyl-ACP synthase III n=1 Tax=Mucilaginibacter jinjuensis TaxID=1176721 RepID=A0ABY7TB47_9SPHI|nr:ketoacyl-ACP synthase III [Mucilaginibacter jinjuensis]WCT13161.1 ketoacyl-ACP synthase III [Mucilaginibacter jinjuensis]
MNKAYIKYIEYYLPDAILDNNTLNEEFPSWSADKISAKTGIYQRHIAAPDEFASDMAIKVAEKLIVNNNIDRSEIDFILLCTQSPDYFLPTTACIVQNKLNIPSSAGALDFNLGCSGYVYGLALAKGLIVSNIAKNVLLITSEVYSKFIHEKDKSNRTIFGDGASATLISNSGLCEIGEFDLGTDGSGANNLIVKEGATRYPERGNTETIDSFGNVHAPACLYMNGPEIFTFTSRAVPELINNTLNKNNLSLAKIDLHIFHQANQFMLEHLMKKIGIDRDRFFIYLKECGNTVSSTIPIALKNAIEGKIKKGDNVLLAGFGVGYSWGATILFF